MSGDIGRTCNTTNAITTNRARKQRDGAPLAFRAFVM